MNKKEIIMDVTIKFRITKELKSSFKEAIGKRGISNVLREFMRETVEEYKKTTEKMP